MKVYLKINWFEQFIYWDITPWVFIWREKERNILKNIILNSHSSSILVSSVRWVWKTSFVHYSLNEIEKEIYPFFVNLWHSFIEKDDKQKKKDLLVAIIRAAHLQNEKDETLNKLYLEWIWKSITKIWEWGRISSDEESEYKFKFNYEHAISILGWFLVWSTLGISDIFIKFFLIILWLFSIWFSKSISKKIQKWEYSKKDTILDDSVDYLELKFENWLKTQKKKIIFVIDELDKIQDWKAFEMIQEYKNFFTRSKAHFIFITAQDEFDRTKESRKGSIYPTFFTNTIYLPHPSLKDLSNYLDEIIEKDLEKFTDEQKKYLICKSRWDIFELKRLLQGMVNFDEHGNYIDFWILEKEDSKYKNLVKVFSHIKDDFLERRFSKLQENWQKNTELLDSTLAFINENLDENFYVTAENFTADLSVVSDLEKWWIITKIDENYYGWSYDEKRDAEAKETEEDKRFQLLYNHTIKIANDLDDFSEILEWEQDDFKKYPVIKENRDGSSISWISLYQTVYSKYNDLSQKLTTKKWRKEISIDEVEEANNNIQEQLNNIKSKYFQILVNLLSNHIKSSNYYKNFVISQANIFHSLPQFNTVFSSIVHKVFWKNDKTKNVLITQDFLKFEELRTQYENLDNQKNILIINIIAWEKYEKKFEEFEKETSRNEKTWKVRTKKMRLTNFITYKISDVRDLKNVIEEINIFLK